jgi:hypothetical protein
MASNTGDMLAMLMAQVIDLQRRVTTQDSIINGLKNDIDFLKGNRQQRDTTGGHMRDNTRNGTVVTRDVTHNNDRRGGGSGGRYDNTMNHSIPLSSNTLPVMSGAGAPNNTDKYNKNTKMSKPRIVNTNSSKKDNTSDSHDGDKNPPVALSAILKDGEEVIIQVGVGKDDDGNFKNATCYATFYGSELTVVKCDLVEDIIGMKSEKPGAILYHFIDKLKDSGHIKRSFTVAPWKLCSVIREGKRMTLEDLRNQ